MIDKSSLLILGIALAVFSSLFVIGYKQTEYKTFENIALILIILAIIDIVIYYLI